MTRILNVEPQDFCQAARDVLQEFAEIDERDAAPRELLETIGEYDVLWIRLARQIDRRLIDAGRRLRAIVSPTTGLDHIDTAYAAYRGVSVLSLRGEVDFLRSIPATAEHTWGLLLALNRQISPAFDSVRRGEWDRDRYRGHDLHGQTLGIVGLGRLGSRVAVFAQAFGMRVLAFDPYVERWPADVERCERLEQLLEQSHVLSLHVPLNDETQRMIGREQLRRLPAGAVVLNTARGDVIDGDSLLETLASGHLRGAALDVIPGERDEACGERQRLLDYARQHEQLLITPHLGGATWESMAATEVFMAKKLRAFLGGELALSAGRIRA